MKKRHCLVGMICILLIVCVDGYCKNPSQKRELKDYTTVHRFPNIDPDYTGVVIPPNIAPLNFFIDESGTRYYVKIHSTHGAHIDITTKNPEIVFPFNQWKKMTSANRGQEIHFEVYTENPKGNWNRFTSITNRIAQEDIDSYLVYRLIEPVFLYWNKMGIYQRNLENYEETPIFINRLTKDNCMNCHSFCQNDPNKMIFHMRAGPASGMLMAREGKIQKIDTKTDFNKPGAYPSWHPNGKILALSVNKLSQIFHAIGENRDVIDKASDLILYLIDSNTVTTSPKISSLARLETFPEWSPDGGYLYFCSAPEFETYADELGDVSFDQIQYDLMRIKYNPEDGTWGELETVLSSAETGLSIAMPRISPDGRFLLFCMFNYGSFPIHRPENDLYLMNLETSQYHRLSINSDKTDSFHSWSSNSRWFVFASKRRDAVCARLYISYIDTNGEAQKPVLLPQKDPTFYNTFLKTYNVPEIIKEPVKLKWRHLLNAALNDQTAVIARLDPSVKLRKPSSDDKEEIQYQQVPK